MNLRRFVLSLITTASSAVLITPVLPPEVIGVARGGVISRRVQQSQAMFGANRFIVFLDSNTEACSPAELVKLKPGDLITSVNGVQINSTEHMRELILSLPETPAEIIYWRYNRALLEHEKRRATMTPVPLRTLPDRSGSASRQGQQPIMVVGINGVLAFVITEVEVGSPVERARLKRGDVITKLNEADVDFKDIAELSESPLSTPVKITYWRYEYSTYKYKKHQTTLNRLRRERRSSAVQPNGYGAERSFFT